MQARATPAEQTRWVDQFIAAAPDNPEGYYLRARLFAEEKNLTGTMEALKEALSKTGRPDHYSRDHAMAVKEGLLASGASVADACLAQRCAPIRRAENTGVSLPVCRVTHFFMDQMEEM